MTDRSLHRFVGEICGFGTASGVRVVVGRWPQSLFGSFADVMLESPDGIRTLLAPTRAVADFVQGTYVFDEVRVVPVLAERSGDAIHIDAGGLVADVSVGRRSALGWLLRAVPNPLARARWWCTMIDPIARSLLDGVRTRGTAGGGRHEFYGATDQHRLAGVTATLDGTDLGGLTDVWPPVRFGFSSTPRTPSLVGVTTTIRGRLDLESRMTDLSGPGEPVLRRPRRHRR